MDVLMAGRLLPYSKEVRTQVCFGSSLGLVLLLFNFWTLNQVGATKPHMLKASGGSQGPRGDGWSEFQGDPWSGSGRRTWDVVAKDFRVSIARNMTMKDDDSACGREICRYPHIKVGSTVFHFRLRLCRRTFL
jgi:hypothetical protein